MKISKFSKKLTQYMALIVLVGCSSKSVNVSEWSDPLGTQEYTEHRRVVSDPKLAKRVQIETFNTFQSEDGLLNVQVQLQNLKRKMQSIEYRFNWIDSNGMVFETPASRWTIKHIFGGDSEIVTGVAPNESIKDVEFKIKRR